MARGKFKTSDIIEAFQKAKGFKSKAAEYPGCSRTTIENYLHRYPTIEKAYQDIIEARHDFVESALMTQIKEGNIAAIIFCAKCQMKSHGYIERQPVEWQTLFNKMGLSTETVISEPADVIVSHKNAGNGNAVRV